MPIKSRNAYAYWNGAAVSEVMNISLKADRGWIEDTAFGDANRTFQADFSDWELTIGRHYDQGGFFGLESDSIAASPSARAMYLYPNRDVLTDYWYGAAFYVSLNSQGGGMSDIYDETYTVKAGGPVYHRTA